MKETDIKCPACKITNLHAYYTRFYSCKNCKLVFVRHSVRTYYENKEVSPNERPVKQRKPRRKKIKATVCKLN